MIRTSSIACVAVLVCSFASTSSAATIEIALQFLDLTYDGTTLSDSGDSLGGDADSLDAVTFRLDGTTLGSITSDIFADVEIPVVLPVPATSPGASVGVSGAGIFDLAFDGDFLLLDVDEVAVTFIDSVTAQFVFGAELTSAIAGQSLPFGLEIGSPVDVSFSAQIEAGTLTDDGEYVTGFLASGSGEVQGPFVPEPSTLLLAGLLAAFGGAVRLRYRLG